MTHFWLTLGPPNDALFFIFGVRDLLFFPVADGHNETFAAQLRDGFRQLRHRSTDVGQLDDISFTGSSQIAKVFQIIWNKFAFGQAIGKLREDSCRQRNIAGLDSDSTQG